MMLRASIHAGSGTFIVSPVHGRLPARSPQNPPHSNRHPLAYLVTATGGYQHARLPIVGQSPDHRKFFWVAKLGFRIE